MICLLRGGELHFFGPCVYDIQEHLCIQGAEKKKKSCHWFCCVLTVVTALALAVNLPPAHLRQYVSARQVKKPVCDLAGRYWEVVQRLKINQFYGAPTAIRLLLNYGEEWVKKYDRSSLKTLGSGKGREIFF